MCSDGIFRESMPLVQLCMIKFCNYVRPAIVGLVFQ